jgi:hypothetical protein
MKFNFGKKSLVLNLLKQPCANYSSKVPKTSLGAVKLNQTVQPKSSNTGALITGFLLTNAVFFAAVLYDVEKKDFYSKEDFKNYLTRRVETIKKSITREQKQSASPEAKKPIPPVSKSNKLEDSKQSEIKPKEDVEEFVHELKNNEAVAVEKKEIQKNIDKFDDKKVEAIKKTEEECFVNFTNYPDVVDFKNSAEATTTITIDSNSKKIQKNESSSTTATNSLNQSQTSSSASSSSSPPPTTSLTSTTTTTTTLLPTVSSEIQIKKNLGNSIHTSTADVSRQTISLRKELEFSLLRDVHTLDENGLRIRIAQLAAELFERFFSLFIFILFCFSFYFIYF